MFYIQNDSKFKIINSFQYNKIIKLKKKQIRKRINRQLHKQIQNSESYKVYNTIILKILL